jgi:hypothetical protein
LQLWDVLFLTGQVEAALPLKATRVTQLGHQFLELVDGFKAQLRASDGVGFAHRFDQLAQRSVQFVEQQCRIRTCAALTDVPPIQQDGVYPRFGQVIRSECSRNATPDDVNLTR